MGVGLWLKNYCHFHLETLTFEHSHENKSCQERVIKRVCERVTFEHRHKNKSCSACRERVNDSVKVLRVLQVFLVPNFYLTSLFLFK